MVLAMPRSLCWGRLPPWIAAWWWSSCAATSGRPRRWRLVSIMRRVSLLSPWMAICSTIPAEIPKFVAKLNEGYDIVSGWREKRIDNLWMRRIPSRCANWAMSKLSGVDLHDFGTTYKAYTRELIEDIPLYGEGLHRFIPALASWYGAKICEVPIVNIDREGGTSHYGISRTIRVFFDLITIRFLLKYMMRPLAFLRRYRDERNRGWVRWLRSGWSLRSWCARQCDGRARAIAGFWRGDAGLRGADAGAWLARRVAGAPFPRASLRPALSRGQGHPQPDGRRERNSRIIQRMSSEMACLRGRLFASSGVVHLHQGGIK